MAESVNFDRVECAGWKDFARFNTGRVALHIDSVDTFEWYHLYAEALDGRCWDGIATCRDTDVFGNQFWVLTVWELRGHKTTQLGRWSDLVSAARDLLTALHALVQGPHNFS